MKKCSIIAAIVTTITIGFNILVNLLPLNGQLTGEISDAFPVYFVPAGYVFSIWGLIYLGMILFTGFLFTKRANTIPRLPWITRLYIIVSLGNIAWLTAWHYELFYLSGGIMLVILFGLIGIHVLDRVRPTGKLYQLCVRQPMRIYLGWISVATVANFSSIFWLLGLQNWVIPPTIWTSIMITIVTVIGLIMLKRSRDFAFVGVVIWALVGIGVKFPDITLIRWSVFSAVTLLSMGTLFLIYKKLKKA